MLLFSVSYSGVTSGSPPISTRSYSFFASTASVGFTAVPFSARNSPPTFFAFAANDTMRSLTSSTAKAFSFASTMSAHFENSGTL